jgi:hypothetical protein
VAESASVGNMKILVWLTEGTWEACVDAARDFPDAEITLLHVVDIDTEAALSGSAGLLGRLAGADPAELLAGAEGRLFDAARARLGRDADTLTLRGRPDSLLRCRCARAGAGR